MNTVQSFMANLCACRITRNVFWGIERTQGGATYTVFSLLQSATQVAVRLSTSVCRKSSVCNRLSYEYYQLSR